MEFVFDCDFLDGLVLIDKQYIEELDEQLLYDFEVCLDRKGKSELIYDFPNRKWDDVYRDAFCSLEKFCATGKMVLFLLDEKSYECIIDFSQQGFETESFLDIKSGNLVLVSASELIQCVAYEELEMETILEMEHVAKGKYAVKVDDIHNIILKKVDHVPEEVRNIVES